MHWRAKYIIIDKNTPVIFPETYYHDEFAAAFTRLDKVTSAGFVYVNDEGAYVAYGESVSLRLKSKGDADSAVLNKYLGGREEI